MATHSSSSTVASNNTDANFRTWINFVHDMMVAAGWSQTADTGQINFATVTAPGASNTKQGYAMYEMTDALASTFPIIVKFAFGSAGAADRPGLWFMVGTHSDGAGNLIDPNDENRAAWLLDQYTQAAPALAKGSASTNTWLSFGSGDGGRVVFVLFEATASAIDSNSAGGTVVPQIQLNDWQDNNHTMLFSIERARNWSGNYVGSHVALVWTSTTAMPNRHAYIEAEHGHVLLSPLTSMSHGLGFGPATAVAPATITYGDSGPPLVGGQSYAPEDLDIVAPATPPIHFLRNTFPVPPGINLQVSRWSRFQFDSWPPPDHSNPPNPSATPVIYVSGTTIAISPYGIPRTYRTVAGLRAPLETSATSGDPTVWVYILYE